MRETFLSFAPPVIDDAEIAEVVETLRSGWITTGPKVKRFEEAFADYIDAETAVALSSCTAALHLALLAHGVRPGQRVITSPMTFCATVNVIEHIGAIPVLADVEGDTLNVDPRLIEMVLEDSSADLAAAAAVVPVHYAGHPCDMDEIHRLALHHRLAVVEDAAHALPARYDGRLVGQLPSDGPPSAVCFSFYATKNLTTAEGGMLVLPPALVERTRMLSLHGMSANAFGRFSEGGSWRYDVMEPGFKYNMTDIQAAIGIAQLGKLPLFQSRRREIARRYNETFAAVESLQVPTERPGSEHAWHLYVLRLNMECLSISRNEFAEQLRLRNIGTSVHFTPVHLHTYYQRKYNYRPSDFPVASREYERILSLPLSPAMSDSDVDDVVEAVLDTAEKHRR